MLELTPENTLDYLRSTGRLGVESAHAEALGWGVSNVVLRVETATTRFVLKQSRPQLRTRDAWFSDLDRVYREQEVMQALQPILPPGVVPEVLFVDRPNFVFAMSHAPMESRVWKEILLTGEVNLTLGEQTGLVLGRMHELTARQPALIAPFADRTVFGQLRVDPFYRRIQERCPDVAHAVDPLIHDVQTRSEALCHGDYSPKNLLVHGDQFTLVDYETAHQGDPSMDLGFFLSHLLLKSIYRWQDRHHFFELTRAFWRGYGREISFAPLPEMLHRGIGHLGLCLLARIDGTSPVDYLTEEWSRQQARRLGRRLLLERPDSWEDVLHFLDQK